MMKIFLTFLFFVNFAHAFTLNNNFGGSFTKSKVQVRIAGDSVCQQGLTIYDLEDIIKPAVEDFWNTVPTSRLRLNAGGFTDPGAVNINLARLCSPTETECLNDTNPDGVIAPVRDIVVSCNRNSKNFGSLPGSNVLAVTVPNNFSGKKIRGAVILINDNSPSYKNLSQKDKIAVMAHEIGHAIGLGHALDENKEALMYYRVMGLRNNLSQDDIDGVTYLYPKKVDGCGLFNGFGGTIDTDKKGPPFWPMMTMLFIMIIISEAKKLLKRSKACATA